MKLGELQKIKLVVVCLVLVGLVNSSWGQSASFQGLGFIAGRPLKSGARAISEDGSTVVGWSGEQAGRTHIGNGEAF